MRVTLNGKEWIVQKRFERSSINGRDQYLLRSPDRKLIILACCGKCKEVEEAGKFLTESQPKENEGER